MLYALNDSLASFVFIDCIYIYIYIVEWTSFSDLAIWRENPLFVNFEKFQKSCMAVKHAIDENKILYY